MYDCAAATRLNFVCQNPCYRQVADALLAALAVRTKAAMKMKTRAKFAKEAARLARDCESRPIIG